MAYATTTRANCRRWVRRFEITIEELVNKTTSQAAELSKKKDLINQLSLERDSQEIEIIALKSQVEALKD